MIKETFFLGKDSENMLEAIGAVIVAAVIIIFGLGLIYQIGFSIYGMCKVISFIL